MAGVHVQSPTLLGAARRRADQFCRARLIPRRLLSPVARNQPATARGCRRRGRAVCTAAVNTGTCSTQNSRVERRQTWRS